MGQNGSTEEANRIPGWEGPVPYPPVDGEVSPNALHSSEAALIPSQGAVSPLDPLISPPGAPNRDASQQVTHLPFCPLADPAAAPQQPMEIRAPAVDQPDAQPVTQAITHSVVQPRKRGRPSKKTGNVAAPSRTRASKPRTKVKTAAAGCDTVKKGESLEAQPSPYAVCTVSIGSSETREGSNAPFDSRGIVPPQQGLVRTPGESPFDPSLQLSMADRIKLNRRHTEIPSAVCSISSMEPNPKRARKAGGSGVCLVNSTASLDVANTGVPYSAGAYYSSSYEYGQLGTPFHLYMQGVRYTQNCAALIEMWPAAAAYGYAAPPLHQMQLQLQPLVMPAAIQSRPSISSRYTHTYSPIPKPDILIDLPEDILEVPREEKTADDIVEENHERIPLQ